MSGRVVDGCLVATRAYERGAIIGTIDGSIVDLPSRTTLQLDEGRHLDVGLPFMHLDHACVPNVAFDTATREVRAISDIAAGDRLRLFYPATEWDMAAVFACTCGSEGCLGVIRGAKWMDRDAVLARGPSAHVRRRLG